MDVISSRQFRQLPSLVDATIQVITCMSASVSFLINPAGSWTKVTKTVLSNGCTIGLVSSSFGASPHTPVTPSALHKECELLQAEAVVDGCCPFGILLSLDHMPPFNKQVANDLCGVTFATFDAFESWYVLFIVATLTILQD